MEEERSSSSPRYSSPFGLNSTVHNKSIASSVTPRQLTATDDGDIHALSAMLGASVPGNSQVFEELLDAEVAVNVNRLREASRQGIDPKYRSVVYRYLLGVAFLDKSREMTIERELEKDFDLLISTYGRLWKPLGDGAENGAGRDGGKRDEKPSSLLGGCSRLRENDGTPIIFLDDSPCASATRCCARGTADGYAAWAMIGSKLRHSEPFVSNDARRQKINDTLAAMQVYYHGASPCEIQNLVTLMLPFDEVSTHARDTFYWLQTTYYMLSHFDNILQDSRALQEHCGRFLLLFRTVNAPLYQHFFSEGVSVLDWVPGMLTTLLAGRLHTDDLLRLWDYYLADSWSTLTFPLHPFVCLAIVAEMTEVLIECERSEILSRLRSLPRVDTTTILQSAISIRESVYAKGLLSSIS